MAKKFLHIGLILFIILDLGYSYKKYASLNLDGDLVPIILPSEHYTPILSDPFGLKVIQSGVPIAGSNRYFCHKTLQLWFKQVYTVLSPHFQDKIAFLYRMQGFAQIIIHASLLFLLSMYCIGHARFWRFDFVLTSSIIAPFFLFDKLSGVLELVMHSVTYSFFYSWIMVLILLFFLPWYLAAYNAKSSNEYFPWPVKILWIFLAVYLCFSGPLVPAVVVLVIGAIFGYKMLGVFKNNQLKQSLVKKLWYTWTDIDIWQRFMFIFVTFLSIYSTYLGRFNIENGDTKPLREMYMLMAKGVYLQWTDSVTYLLMFLISIVNIFFLRRSQHPLWLQRFWKLSLWIASFCLIYLLLLPFGGYRPYRPNILRFDTLLPINTLWVLFIGVTSIHLLKSLQKKTLYIFTPILLIILGIFYTNDTWKFDQYYCQNDSFHLFQKAQTDIIYLDPKCPVLDWMPSNWDVAHKNINTMLQYWQITDHEHLYEYK